MKPGAEIDFRKWPKNATSTGKRREIPYLDIEGEDEPIKFLFTLNGKHGLIARANLHTLQGTKKAGKSAAGLALIVAALKGDFIGIAANYEGLRVLWIDTEQDTATLKRKARAALSMARLDIAPECLKIVTLRGYGGAVESLAATIQAIEENAPDFVFLDGVVDLCQAFNDEEKSREVVRSLEAAAESTGAAILGLIHTNKKDNEARGHLGAIIVQKSAEIYQVDKTGDTARVKQPFSRFAPVPDFSFSFLDDFKITNTDEIGAENKRRQELQEKFTPLFVGVEKLTSTELNKKYQDKHGVKKDQANKMMRQAVEANIIVKEQSSGKGVFYSLPFAGVNVEDDDPI